MYQRCFKRLIDFMLSFLAIIVLSPVLVIFSVLGAVFMQGNPFFTQLRPGKDEKIFKLIKFRSMNNRKDENGKLLSDDERLTKYGKWLRNTSIDELPELFNILKGDMAIVGPRPQLVRDMVFMSGEQRKRHTVRPGLTGLAQVNGRNAISWENKLNFDLEYIKGISLVNDIRIILKTIKSVFITQEGITYEEMGTAPDYGDYLLNNGLVNKDQYDKLQTEARILIEEYEKNK